MTNYISLGENRSALALSFSLRHRTTPEGVVILQISMKSSTRSHRTICLIKNQVFREYKRLFLSSVPCVWILIACVCICVCVCVHVWCHHLSSPSWTRKYSISNFGSSMVYSLKHWKNYTSIHRLLLPFPLFSLLAHLFFFFLFSLLYLTKLFLTFLYLIIT